MASSNGDFRYTFGGVTYTKELEPPNQERIKELAQQYIDSSKVLKSPTLKANALAQAIRDERIERYKKARDAFFKDNAAALERGEDPEEFDDEGNMKQGKPGISQERTDQVPPIVGAVPDHAPQQVKIVSEEERRTTQAQTLADKLNERLTKNHISEGVGYVTKTIDSPDDDSTYLEKVADMAYQSMGAGHRMSQLAQMFYGADRFGHSLALKNTELTGYTFITRPRLNLSTPNLAGDRFFAGMITADAMDVATYVRLMFDPKFATDSKNANLVKGCMFFNNYSPFCNLLGNNLVAINGFVDPFVTTETTDAGYFQESQTYVIGGDRLARTYELPLTFRDLPGGPVMYAFDMWYRYLMNLQDGSMVQYAADIDANRLGYTSSIYRFIVDKTKRTITKWAKCTGCFPVNSPVGVPFNKNQGEVAISSTDFFTINWKANRIEYNDPIILQEFNTLVRRYTGIEKNKGDLKAYSMMAQNNFYGIPYIRIGTFGNELLFIKHDSSDDGAIIERQGGSGNIPANTIL